MTIEIKGLDELVKRIGKLGDLQADIYAPIHVAFGQVTAGQGGVYQAVAEFGE